MSSTVVAGLFYTSTNVKGRYSDQTQEETLATRRIGVEVDGSKATSVELMDDRVVSAQAFTGEDQIEALAKWSNSVKGKADTRVVWVTKDPLSVASPVNLPENTPESRFRDELKDSLIQLDLLREDSDAAVIGSVGPVQETSEYRNGVVALAPNTTVQALYSALGRRVAELTLTAFAYPQDGLWLSVRETAIEMVLVENGIPLEHRVAGSPALALLKTQIRSAERFGSLFTDSPDQNAFDQSKRWSDQLYNELSSVLDTWHSRRTIPPSMFLVGSGSRLPAIKQMVSELGYSPIVVADTAASFPAVLSLPEDNRSQYTGALLAALTVGQHSPLATFIDEGAQSRARAGQVSQKRRKRAFQVLAALAAGAVFFGAPVYYGHHSVSVANAHQAAAQRRLAAVAPQFAEYSRLAQIDNAYSTLGKDITFDVVIGNVYGLAAQDGVDISSVQTRTDGSAVTVSISGSIPNGTYDQLTKYVEDLKGNFTPTDIFISNFSSRDGKVQMAITMSVPTSSLTSTRKALS